MGSEMCIRDRPYALYKTLTTYVNPSLPSSNPCPTTPKAIITLPSNTSSISCPMGASGSCQPNGRVSFPNLTFFLSHLAHSCLALSTKPTTPASGDTAAYLKPLNASGRSYGGLPLIQMSKHTSRHALLAALAPLTHPPSPRLPALCQPQPARMNAFISIFLAPSRRPPRVTTLSSCTRTLSHGFAG